MGVALQKSGVDFSNYKTGPLSSEGYPRGQKVRQIGYGKNLERPKIVPYHEFKNNYLQNTTGIFFMPMTPHIDLFNKGTTGSGLFYSDDVWFWEIK